MERYKIVARYYLVSAMEVSESFKYYRINDYRELQVVIVTAYTSLSYTKYLLSYHKLSTKVDCGRLPKERLFQIYFVGERPTLSSRLGSMV